MDVQMMTGTKMHKLFTKKNNKVFSCFCMVSAMDGHVSPVTIDHSALKELITQFEPIFAVPKSLPPMRNCNHGIKLKENTEPFKQQAYRYPYLQRQEIEKLVKEMLETG